MCTVKRIMWDCQICEQTIRAHIHTGDNKTAYTHIHTTTTCIMPSPSKWKKKRNKKELHTIQPYTNSQLNISSSRLDSSVCIHNFFFIQWCRMHSRLVGRIIVCLYNFYASCIHSFRVPFVFVNVRQLLIEFASIWLKVFMHGVKHTTHHCHTNERRLGVDISIQYKIVTTHAHTHSRKTIEWKTNAMWKWCPVLIRAIESKKIVFEICSLSMQFVIAIFL